VSLSSKFSRFIDETNVRLFTELVKAATGTELRLWVHPLDQLPSADEYNRIIAQAKKPALPDPKPNN
jgi:hypothetical protein